MNKLFRRVISSLMILSLVFTTLLLGNTVKAVDDKKTKVNVIKIRVQDKDNFKLQEHDGKKINDLNQKFGNTYELLQGVTFKAFKIDSSTTYEEMLKTPENFDTLEKVKSKLNLTDTNSNNTSIIDVTTDKNGLALFDLSDGNYWFIESAKPAGYENALSVPFGLSLPTYNENGRMSELYLYPKNTVTNPFDPTATKDPLTKTVVDDKKKTTSVDYNEEFQWMISAKVPKAATDLKKLEFREILHEALDFTANSLEVNIVEAGKDNVKLTKDTDYTLVEPTADRKLSVDFKADGIKKLTSENSKIQITYKSKVNNKAVMGGAIYNGVQVIFGNTENGEKYSELAPVNKNIPENANKTHGPISIPTTEDGKLQVPDPIKPELAVIPQTNPSEEDAAQAPFVTIGGKAFVKQDKNTKTTKLKGAEFAIVKSSGTDLFVLTEVDSKYTWAKLDGVADADKEDNAKLSPLAVKVPNVKKLTSAEQGAFEIKGLAFGDYYLVETKAPEKYGVPTNTFKFTINQASYYTDLKDKTSASPADVEAMEVNNQKYIIPQTGGIGAIIFVVVGIAIMLTAGVLLLRKKKDI